MNHASQHGGEGATAPRRAHVQDGARPLPPIGPRGPAGHEPQDADYQAGGSHRAAPSGMREQDVVHSGNLERDAHRRHRDPPVCRHSTERIWYA